MRSAIFSIFLSIVTAWVMGRPAPSPAPTACAYFTTTQTAAGAVPVLAATFIGQDDLPQAAPYVVSKGAVSVAVENMTLFSVPTGSDTSATPVCAGPTYLVLASVEGRSLFPQPLAAPLDSSR